MNGEIFISRLSAWAPGIENASQWNEWAHGKREILCNGKAPELPFTDSMFRRRLSHISKMTIKVTRDLMPFAEDAKIFFFSFRGEISRQLQINRMLIEENSLSPAFFSLSVFNAPAALSTMALGLKGGYCAVYPGSNSFSACILTAIAALTCGTANELVIIYADEEVPAEYGCLFNALPEAAAFGLLLTRTKGSNIPILKPDENEFPLLYLKRILLEDMSVSS